MASSTRYLRSLVTVVFLFSFSACLRSPYNNYVVETTSERIKFDGAVFHPGEQVTIEALNVQTGLFETIAAVEATTSPGPFRGPDGQALYSWEVLLVLPAQYWRAGTVCGFSAKVRASAYGWHLMTLESDWLECWTEHPDHLDFALHCASDRSPEAVIVTADFEDTFQIAPRWPSPGVVASPMVNKNG